MPLAPRLTWSKDSFEAGAQISNLYPPETLPLRNKPIYDIPGVTFNYENPQRELLDKTKACLMAKLAPILLESMVPTSFIKIRIEDLVLPKKAQPVTDGLRLPLAATSKLNIR